MAFSYTVKVEIAFVSNPFGTLTWTDVSQWATAWQTHRGRNYDLGTMEAGTAQVTLWNIDGRFSPDNTGSPYFPYVLPYRPIRITATTNGTTYNVWRGFVERWPQQWSLGGAYTETTITAVDAFTPVLSATMGPRYADAITDDANLGAAQGAYLPAGSGATASSNQFGGTSAVSFQAINVTDPYTLTTMSGSLVSSTATTGYSRLVAHGTHGVGMVLRSSGGTTVNVISSELRFRVHVADTHTTHPPVTVIRVSASNYVFLLHSATATSGYKLAFGSSTSTLLSTWGDIALDQVIALGVVREGGASGGYKLFVNGTFWYDASTDTSSTTTPLDSVFDAAPGAASYVSSTFTLDVDQFVFYMATPTSPPSIGQLTDTMIGTHYAISGQSGNPIPDFPSQTTGARIGAVLDVIGWPSADRVLDTGSSTLAAAGDVEGKTALELILEAASAELGEAFIDGQGRFVFHGRHHRDSNTSAATFGDAQVGAGEIAYEGDVTLEFDITRVINDVTIAQSIATAPQTSIRFDATSQAAYGGKKSFSESYPLLNSSDCDGMADTIIARYKDAHLRVDTITINLAPEQARMIAALAREIGDTVTFKRRPPGGWTTSIPNVVEGIAFDYTHGPDRKFTATFELEPTPSNATY